jgi:hypothetical protein
MHPSKQTVLLGSSGRLPFNGEFYFHLELSTLNIEIIGRVGSNQRPEDSWESCLNIREALKEVEGEDPLSATRSAWDRLLAIPRRDFGPNLGEDLSVMVVARGKTRGALSAVGLKSIWSLSTDNQCTVIVGPDMPEVNNSGIPRLPPKALELDNPNTVFVGSINTADMPSQSKVAALFPSYDERSKG